MLARLARVVFSVLLVHALALATACSDDDATADAGAGSQAPAGAGPGAAGSAGRDAAGRGNDGGRAGSDTVPDETDGGRTQDAGGNAGAGADGGSGGAGSGGAGSGGAGSGGAGSGGGGANEPGDCGGDKPGPDNTGVPPGTVLADDVTIRRVRITTGDYYPIRYFDEDNVGLVVEDSEIAGTSGNATSAIAFRNYTARRLNVHGMADGFKADANVLIEDCFIHDLSNGDGEHNDGVQSTGGQGVTLRHNAISGASNAAVQTGDESAATEDLTIECNWLSGGGYTLNIRGSGDTRPRNTRIIDNRFGRDSAYGPWVIDDPDPTVTGNVYDDDSEPIEY